MNRIEGSRRILRAHTWRGTRYQMDDRAPYLWKTRRLTAGSGTRIVQGIRADDFAHVVRENPARAGLLYAGTEHGVYVSHDDGAHWQSLSLNLPDVQVIDMEVKGRDLVIATHGRGFYVLDDLTPLRQWRADRATAPVQVLKPEPAIRRGPGAVIDFHLAQPAQDVRVVILDADGDVVRTITGKSGAAGFHRMRWDVRHAGATPLPGIVVEGRNPSQGPYAAPGAYVVKVTADGVAAQQPLQVVLDPRLRDVTDAEVRAQTDLALRLRDRVSAAHEAVLHIRALRKAMPRGAVADSLSAIEAELYQVRNQSPKDKIAFPIKLNNRLSGLLGILEQGDAAPTAAQLRVYQELSADLDVQLRRLMRCSSGTT